MSESYRKPLAVASKIDEKCYFFSGEGRFSLIFRAFLGQKKFRFPARSRSFCPRSAPVLCGFPRGNGNKSGKLPAKLCQARQCAVDARGKAMPAVPDYTVGFTQAEVERILQVQKGELTKTMAEYAESGSNVVKRRLDEIHEIISACQKALRKFDPDTYGAGRRVAQSQVVGGFSH